MDSSSLNNSLFDALIPRLGIENALVLSQCSKDMKRMVSESYDEIIKNDKETPLVVLYRLMDECMEPSSQKHNMVSLKTFKEEIQNEPSIFLNLLLNEKVLDDWKLQDIYISYLYNDVKNVYVLDRTIAKLISVYMDHFSTINPHITKVTRAKGLTFLIRILGAHVRWLISSGNQHNVSMIYMRTFNLWNIIDLQITYMKGHMLAFPKGTGAIRANFSYALKQNERFFGGFVKKFMGVMKGSLCMGPRGGVYIINSHGMRVYV